MRDEEPIAYSVVVPFYNEQESIPALYVKITEVMDAAGEPYEMVFVDDGSQDDTYKILQEIHEHDRRVNLVRLRRNFGQTAALKAGFDFARGEIIVSMDGDLQHDPAEIPLFLEKMKEGYDIVSGWRVERRDPWLTRQLPSRVANRIMAWLSGLDLHDFGTTFKAYRREVWPRSSSTATCTASSLRWRAGAAPGSPRCPSRTFRARTASPITAWDAPSACCSTC